MSRAVKEWVGKTDDTPAPPRVRLRVFQRENGICHLSGRKIEAGEPWQLDHKIALINGGENRESNLFPALADKHKEKTKADVAEKAKVAATAKKHIGATRPAGKLRGAPFPKSAQAQHRADRDPKPHLPPRALYVPK
jgi:5-methylcytosine-specific restriction endonuclease McrA